MRIAPQSTSALGYSKHTYSMPPPAPAQLLYANPAAGGGRASDEEWQAADEELRAAHACAAINHSRWAPPGARMGMLDSGTCQPSAMVCRTTVG